MKLPFNPLIVLGLFMLTFAGGSYLTSGQFLAALVAFTLLVAALLPASLLEKAWYVKHGRPKMTYLAMVVINVSEWMAGIYGLMLGYALMAR